MAFYRHPTRSSLPVVLLLLGLLFSSAAGKCVYSNAACLETAGDDAAIAASCGLCKCVSPVETALEGTETLAPATLCRIDNVRCKQRCTDDADKPHPLAVAQAQGVAAVSCLSACSQCECKSDIAKKFMRR